MYIYIYIYNIHFNTNMYVYIYMYMDTVYARTQMTIFWEGRSNYSYRGQLGSRENPVSLSQAG